MKRQRLFETLTANLLAVLMIGGGFALAIAGADEDSATTDDVDILNDGSVANTGSSLYLTSPSF